MSLLDLIQNTAASSQGAPEEVAWNNSLVAQKDANALRQGQIRVGDLANEIQQAEHIVNADGNLLDKGLGATASTIDAIGSGFMANKLTDPITNTLRNLHSNDYQAHQMYRNAKNQAFDQLNRQKYYKDISEGKSSTEASLGKIGREAMHWYDSSTGSDLVEDTLSTAGSLVGSYVVGGVYTKTLKLGITAIAEARLASNLASKVNGYQRGIKSLQETKQNLIAELDRLTSAVSPDIKTINETKAALAETENCLKQAILESDQVVKEAVTSTKELASTKNTFNKVDNNPILNDYDLQHAFIRDQAKNNLIATEQNAINKANALVKNQKTIQENAVKQQTLKEAYFNQTNKLEQKGRDLEKQIAKIDKSLSNKQKLLDKATSKKFIDQATQKVRDSVKVNPAIGGTLTNLAFGASEGLSVKDELDNISLDTFKEKGTATALNDFNKLKEDYINKGHSIKEAEELAFKDVKSNIVNKAMSKTALAEAGIGFITGRAHAQGKGIKGLVGKGYGLLKDQVTETTEELGQTFAENYYRNESIANLDKTHDRTKNLGRELAQTGFGMPMGMNATKGSSLLARAGYNFLGSAGTAGSTMVSAYKERAKNKTIEDVVNGKANADTLDKSIKESITYADDAIYDQLDSLRGQGTSEDVVQRLKESSKKGKTLIDTRDAFLGELETATSKLKSSNSSQEEKGQQLKNVINLSESLYGLLAGHAQKYGQGSLTTSLIKNFIQKVKDLNIEEDILKGIVDIANAGEEKASEKDIEELSDKIKNNLKFANILIDSNTSEEAIDNINNSLKRINPSYAHIPELQELTTKAKLAKAYQQWRNKTEDDIDSLEEYSLESLARSSKLNKGKKSFKGYLDSIAQVLDNPITSQNESKVALHNLATQATFFQRSQEDKINQIDKVISDIKDNNLEAYKDLIKDGVLTYSSLSKGSTKVPFTIKVKVDATAKDGYSLSSTETLLTNMKEEQKLLNEIVSIIDDYATALSEEPVKESKETSKKTATTSKNFKSVNSGSNPSKTVGKAKPNGKVTSITSKFLDNVEESLDKNIKVIKISDNAREVTLSVSSENGIKKIKLKFKPEYRTKWPENIRTADMGGYKGAKVLIAAMKFAATYEITDKKERLAKQKEIIESLTEYKSGGRHKKVFFDHIFTKDSLAEAGYLQKTIHKDGSVEYKPIQGIEMPGISSPSLELEQHSLDKGDYQNYSFPFALQLFFGMGLDNNETLSSKALITSSNQEQDKYNNLFSQGQLDSKAKGKRDTNTGITEEDNKDDTEDIKKDDNYPIDLFGSKASPQGNVNVDDLPFDENNIQETDDQSSEEDNDTEEPYNLSTVIQKVYPEQQDPSTPAETRTLEQVVEDQSKFSELSNNKIVEQSKLDPSTKLDNLILVRELNALNTASVSFEESRIDETTLNTLMSKYVTNNNLQGLTDQIGTGLDTILAMVNEKIKHTINKAAIIQDAHKQGMFRFMNFIIEESGNVKAIWKDKDTVNRLKLATSLALLQSIDRGYSNLISALETDVDGELEGTYLGARDPHAKKGTSEIDQFDELQEKIFNTGSKVVSIAALGSLLNSNIHALLPYSANENLPIIGGKLASEQLVSAILTSLLETNQGTINANKLEVFEVFTLKSLAKEKNKEKLRRVNQTNLIMLPKSLTPDDESKQTINSIKGNLKKDLKDIAKLTSLQIGKVVGTKDSIKGVFKTPTKLRRTSISNTDSQIVAGEILKNTPHEVNSYGKLLTQLKAGDYVEALKPSKDYISKDAKLADVASRDQVERSFNEVIDTDEQIRESIKETGREDTYVFYDNDFTKANRLNALYYQSYRNSKTVREGITPIGSSIKYSTIQSNPKIASLWKRAVMQGMGSKVQNIENTDKDFVTFAKLLKGSSLSKGDKQALINAFLDLGSNPADLGNAFKKLASVLRENGYDVTEVSMHNAIEALVYLYHTEKDADYTSYVYGEADGITNGIFFSKLINAVYSSNPKKEFTNLLRVGLGVGIVPSEQDSSFYINMIKEAYALNKEVFKSTNIHPLIANQTVQDIYTTVAKLLSDRLNNAENLAVIYQANTDYQDEHLSSLASSALKVLVPYLSTKGVNATIDGNNNISITRNGVKNPVTQSNYSAGTQSIADAMIKALKESWNKGLGVKVDGKANTSLKLDFNNASFAQQRQIVTQVLEAKSNEEVYEVLKTSKGKVLGLDYIEKHPELRDAFINQVKIQCALGFINSLQYDYKTREYRGIKQNFSYDVLRSKDSESEDINKSDYFLDNFSLKNASYFVKQFYVDSLFTIMEDVMGESSSDEHILTIVEVSSLAVAYHKDMLAQELYDSIQKKGVYYLSEDKRETLPELLGIAQEYLSAKELKAIYKKVTKQAPYATKIFSSEPELDKASFYTGFTYKTGRASVNSSYDNSWKVETKAARPSITYHSGISFVDEGGVSPRPLSNIALGDAATMTSSIISLAQQGVSFQDIFDGINISPDQYAKGSDSLSVNGRINRIAFVKGLQTNIVKGYYRIWKSIKKEVETSNVYGRKYLTESTNRIENKDTNKIDVSDLDKVMLNEIRKVDINHQVLLCGVLPITCDQYAFDPEGAYVKNSNFKVGDSYYSINQSLTLEQSSKVFTYLQNRITKVYDSIKGNPDEKNASEFKNKVKEVLSKDEQLIPFLVREGISVVPVEKPKSKKKVTNPTAIGQALKDANITSETFKPTKKELKFVNALDTLKSGLTKSYGKAYKGILNMLNNNGLKDHQVAIIKRSEIDILPDHIKQVVLGISAENSVYIPLEDNTSLIVLADKADINIQNHELFHALFKRVIAEAYTNNTEQGEKVVKELEKLVSLIENQAKGKNKEYIANLKKWVKDTSNNRIDYVDELITQVVFPTATQGLSGSKPATSFMKGFASFIKTTFESLVDFFAGSNLSEKFGENPRLATLITIVSLSNKIQATNPETGSFAFIPSNEDLKRILDTKPKQFKRLVKAFTYNNNSRLANIKHQFTIDGVSQVDTDQATRWAMYDDIITNKALSDDNLIDLSNLYNVVIKSDTFKESNLPFYIKDIMLGFYGSNDGASQNATTETSPLSNFMYLVETDPAVRKVISKINLPKALQGKFQFKVDQVINDIISNVYNNFIEKSIVSSKYDLLLAKIVAENSILDIMQPISDTIHTVESKANSITNNLIDRALIKVGSTIAKHATGIPHDLAKSIAGIGAIESFDKDTTNIVDAVSVTASWVDQSFPLFNSVSHVLQDLAGVNIENFEPLSLLKKVKANLDRIANKLAKEVPLQIRNKFNKLTQEDEVALTNHFLKLDVSCLVEDGTRIQDIEQYLHKDTALKEAKSIISQASLNRGQINKISQLAKFLVSGNTNGKELLKNAYIISKYNKTPEGTDQIDMSLEDNPKLIKQIDKAITLLALSKLEQNQLDQLSNIIFKNYLGMKDFTNMHIAVKKSNLNKMSDAMKLNYQKGYVPTVYSNQCSLKVVTSMDEVSNYKRLGYDLVAAIRKTRSMHFSGNIYLLRSPLPQSSYRQGIIRQNKYSLYGIDSEGIAHDNLLLLDLDSYSPNEDTNKEFNPIPVFNENGEIDCYEVNIGSKLIKNNIPTDTNPFNLLGKWYSTDYIMNEAKHYNLELAKLNAKMYQHDLEAKSNTFIKNSWVNIQDLARNDKIIKDAWYKVPYYVKAAMAKAQNCSVGNIKIRRDMVDLFLGYKQASVTDLWTGVSRWDSKTCQFAAKLAEKVLGPDAYKYLAYAERTIQYTTAYARNAIVIRSVAVPFMNMTANILQLRMRGIPFSTIVPAIKTKVRELETYADLTKNQLKISTKIATMSNITSSHIRNLKIRSKLIDDTINNLSIAPMIRAGELSTISDVGENYNDSLFTGQWAEKIDDYVKTLPDGLVQAGKWLSVDRNSALYQMMEKATLYGDFVAKSIYYDYLIQQGKSEKDALIASMNEFVNYDMLAGRNREYLENMGILWFYNYSLRSIRTSLDIALHNPVSALLSLTVLPDFVTDNNIFKDTFLGKLFRGVLGGTFCNPNMIIAPLTKNPLIELVSM